MDLPSLASPRTFVLRGAAAHGDRPAVVGPGVRWSYRELAHRATAVAARLVDLGVGPGVQVALSLSSSASFPSCYFGVLQAGGIVVPLAPSLRPVEGAELLDRGGIRYVIAAPGTSWVEALEPARCHELASLEGVAIFECAGAACVLETAPWTDEGIVARGYSSGSTGRPKALLRTEYGLAHDAWRFTQRLNLQAGMTFLAVSPFHHAYGALGLLSALSIGGCLIVLPRFLPGELLEVSCHERPNVFLATPPMIELLGSCRLEPAEERAFDGLVACVCSTGYLGRSAHARFRERYGVFVGTQYGSTETLSATLDLGPGFEEGRVGLPYPGVEVGVFDELGRACGAGEVGLVGVRSPSAVRGYVADPEATARVFRGGRVFPGDRGALDASGRLLLAGRSEVISVGGEKVDPLEVAAVIRAALPVGEVVVLEGRRAGLASVDVFVEAEPGRVTPAMIVSACKARLSPHKVPARVEVHPRLPRDENGKIRCADLRAPASGDEGRGSE